MTIRADSYGSTAEVKAFTRNLLDGQTAFNSTTRPTVTEVEKFLDRASGTLNLALRTAGFAPANIIANSTAKLACDDWTVARACEYAELTHRGVGYSDAEGSRTAAFRNLTKSANDFVNANSLGFVREGVSQGYKKSDGLAFTGQDAQDDRTDPSDTSMEQPFAVRRQWDNKRIVNFNNTGGSR